MCMYIIVENKLFLYLYISRAKVLNLLIEITMINLTMNLNQLTGTLLIRKITKINMII